MGRSFSFSGAWARNQRMVDRLERQGDADDYEVEYQRAPSGEIVGQRLKLKTGSTLGFEERDWHHKGEPVEFVGEEKDYGDGTVSLDYAVRSSSGRIETYRATWEKTSDRGLVARGARRVRE